MEQITEPHPSLSSLSAPLPAIAMIDHAMLVAGAAVRQAATYTATLAEHIRLPRAPGDMPSAHVATFVAEDRRAAAWLGGSFHPRVAGDARGPAASTFVKSAFTLAF